VCIVLIKQYHTTAKMVQLTRIKRRLSDAVADPAQAAKQGGKQMQRFALLLWNEIPAWQQEDNKLSKADIGETTTLSLPLCV
jgi:hypothetical protein